MTNKQLACSMWFVVETMNFWFKYTKHGTLNAAFRNDLLKEYKEVVASIIKKLSEEENENVQRNS